MMSSRQPRQVYGDHGEHERGLSGEVACGGSVYGVVRGRGEPEFLGDGVGVQAQ